MPASRAETSYAATIARQDVLNTLAAQSVLLRNLTRRALRPDLADAFEDDVPKRGILQQLQKQTQHKLATAQTQFREVFDPTARQLPPGSPVYAVKPGDVSYVGRLSGYDNVIIIRQDAGGFGVYGGLASVQVHRGQPIDADDLLGQLPETGQPRFLYEERP